MLVFFGVTKQVGGDLINGLTTTFGAVGSIFYQKIFYQWLPWQPLAHQPLEQLNCASFGDYDFLTESVRIQKL
jgi:hypothetical protein